VKIDEEEIRKMYMDKLQEHIEKMDRETLFWDTKRLKQETNMCWNTIQEKFFYNEDFPKRKIGGKWFFHGERTREFLDKWFFEDS
jgi:hypothetical protein